MKNLLIILLMLLSSCNSDNNMQETNIEADIGFYLLDSNGNDLLNPNNPNGIDLDIVRVYEIINGEEVEINNPNLDGPHGFVLLEPEGIYDKYRLSLGLNIKEISNPTTTIVKWNTTDIDIFKSEYNRGDNFIICTKIWLNNDIVWKTSDGVRFIEITK